MVGLELAHRKYLQFCWQLVSTVCKLSVSLTQLTDFHLLLLAMRTRLYWPCAHACTKTRSNKQGHVIGSIMLRMPGSCGISAELGVQRPEMILQTSSIFCMHVV
jgi:hypothetical protein